MLSTPQYQIRKDKKSGLLVSPSKVTVVGVVDQEDLGGEEDAPVQGSGEQEVFMSADLSVSWHYVVTLRRGRPRPREQLLLQNYKA